MDLLEKKKKNDIKILIIFTVLTLILRWITLMEVNTGGDNIDYWYFAKALWKRYPYTPVFHRSIRWGILLPTSLIQLLLGTHSWVIYVPSILLTLLLNINIYWIGKRIYTREAAFLAIILTQMFPYMIRLSSQLFLALFSVNYLMLSFLFLYKYLFPTDDRERNREKAYFLISIAFMFFAYLTKITNLYFLIPWLIMLFRYKGIQQMLKYGLILFGLYLIEHVCYFIFLGEPLGRLGIILNTHISSGAMEIGEGGNFDGTFLGLFKRYKLEYFPLYWHGVLWLGLVSGFVLYKKNENRKATFIIILMILTFMLIITFGITGINPVTPFEDFIPRYFTPLLPFLNLMIAAVILIFFRNIFEAIRKHLGRVSFYSFFYVLPLSLILLMSILLPKLPSSAKEYLNPILQPEQHQLIKMVQWERILREAEKEGQLLACWTENSDFGDDQNRLSRKSLDTVNRLLLDQPRGIGAYPIKPFSFSSEKTLLFLESEPGLSPLNTNEWILSYRFPFQLDRLIMDDEMIKKFNTYE